MRRVVFFISGHGFGHASRQVEIIHALNAIRPDVGIVIRSAVSPALLHRTVNAPYELRPGACDTGIVQTSSIQHDDKATIAEAIAFYESYERRIEEETRALATDAERPALIVGDIAPLAFEVASRLRVPGVAIGNFTWDWIYDTHPGMTAAAPWLVPRLRESYRLATLAIELPFAGGFEVFTDVRAIPLVSRHPSRSRTDTRAQFGIPHDRPAALLSFGGYGLPDFDPAAVDALGAWTIVTTDRSVRPDGSPVRDVVFVPESGFVGSGFRYEDVVAAVDAVVTKPGYGIVAECITAGTPVLYTSRGEFREYDLLVREMARYLRCRFISQADLLGGRWLQALEELVVQPAPGDQMNTTGAAFAAMSLSRVLGASS